MKQDLAAVKSTLRDIYLKNIMQLEVSIFRLRKFGAPLFADKLEEHKDQIERLIGESLKSLLEEIE